MKNLVKLVGVIALVAVIGFTGCSTIPELMTVNYPGGTTSAGIAQSPLDGVWVETSQWTRTITVSGNTGVFTSFGTNALVRDAVNKGFYKIGGIYLRNITKTGDLTWTCQELGVDGSDSNATGVRWLDYTITLSADGQTFQIGSFVTFARRQ